MKPSGWKSYRHLEREKIHFPPVSTSISDVIARVWCWLRDFVRGGQIDESLFEFELRVSHIHPSKLSQTGSIMSAHAQYRVCTCSVKGKYDTKRVKVVQQQKMHNL